MLFEIDTGLYDRQIRTYGYEAVKKDNIKFSSYYWTRKWSCCRDC